MKKTILFLFFALFLVLLSLAQPIAKVDTIYRKYDILNFKPDTIKFNLLSNDIGSNLKIIEFSINCTRYTSISTFKSIPNFGKIKLSNTGVGTFISTKYIAPNKPIYEFLYTINDGKCGTSQGKVIIADSSAWYTSDKTKAYIYMIGFGWGYYLQEGNLYFIQFPSTRLVCTKEEYDYAILNGIK